MTAGAYKPMLSPLLAQRPYTLNKQSRPITRLFSKGHRKRYHLFSPQNSDSNRDEPDRPFTLPPGQFRPKQSLGQNYLSDQNYVAKIVEAFIEHRKIVCPEVADDKGERVVEIGPGTGALTRTLYPIFPKMKAIEIDQRSVTFLKEKFPELPVYHMDALQCDWRKFAADHGGRISVVANLPYYIVSQVLFSLVDTHEVVNNAVVTMQWEVAERICARPRTKDYGIPSVVFQLYAKSSIAFKIPPKVFYPAPKVDSGLVCVDFTKPHPDLHKVYPEQLRKVLVSSFQQRRKMMRQSLRELLMAENLVIPSRWAECRPEELSPEDFLVLTAELFRGRLPEDNNDVSMSAMSAPSNKDAFGIEETVESRTNTKDLPYLCNQKRGVWRGVVM